jgi:protein-L-isoaspartate(D-aspartate) O-methyltransferase
VVAFSSKELKTLRRAYARLVTFLGNSDDSSLEESFANVPREAYVGPGPWQIFQWTGSYITTPDADPAWLYSDNLIGLDPQRGLNNGQPSAHARWITAATPRPGEHVVHVAAGVGYYSAIMANMVGTSGSVTAIEYDLDLAMRAKSNLACSRHGCTGRRFNASV